MNDKHVNARLGWLSLTLAHQRNNIANLMLRLKDVGMRLGTSLGLQKKFLRLLEQIAYDREIEKDILNEIETVEKLHLEMKQRKMLRRAEPETATPKPKNVLEDKPEEKPKRSGLLTLFGLLLLFSPRRNKQKNQDLTVD